MDTMLKPEEVASCCVDSSHTLARWLPKALLALGMVKSSSEGRRMIKMGAINLDGEKITYEELRLAPGLEVLVKVGKRCTSASLHIKGLLACGFLASTKNVWCV